MLMVAFAEILEARFFENPVRGWVFGVNLRDHTLCAQVIECKAQERACDLAGKSLSLVFGQSKPREFQSENKSLPK